MRKKYVIEYSWTAHDYHGLRYIKFSFVPSTTVIDCDPPYRKGQEDSNWISYNPKVTKLPKLTDKKGWEEIFEISLLPISK